MKKNIFTHLTAKNRDKLSFPANWLFKNNYLKGKILDFGCGFGTDVKILKAKGMDIIGYDKYYFKKYPEEKFDTIICIYVLNVLEQREQSKVIMSVSELLKPGGKAYFVVRRDLKYEGYRLHKIHKKYTYQTNVKLRYKTIFLNSFCEIYEFEHFNKLKHQNPDCIFCNPENEIITESATAYAVFDKFPVSEGHALIIPKRHVANYFDLTLNEQIACSMLINRVKKIIDQQYSPDAYNVGINIGKDAGQTIQHVHIHLIPRYKGDVENPVGGVRNIIPGKGNYLEKL